MPPVVVLSIMQPKDVMMHQAPNLVRSHSVLSKGGDVFLAGMISSSGPFDEKRRVETNVVRHHTL